MPHQQDTRDNDPRADSTTHDDAWASLGDEKAAAIWRAIEGLQNHLAKEINAALRAVQTGKTDTLIDADALRTQTRRALEQLATDCAGDEALVATLGDLAARYDEYIRARRDATPTGLANLDRALGGGLQPGRLMVVLGAPGKGKTTLANQIAEHVANGGRPVVYVTMEDPAADLLAKTVARLGGLDYTAVLQGRESMRKAINDTLAKVATRWSAQRLLYIEQPGRLSVDALRERAAEHFARYDASVMGGGPGLLVVDYLQRAARAATPAGAQTELRLAVSDLTDRLRAVARDLDCTVLALGSQNRAGYGNGAGALASAKESGDIEYGCDVLAALGEDGDNKRVAPMGCKPWALSLAKNRQGDTCTLVLDWMPARQQFTEAAK